MIPILSFWMVLTLAIMGFLFRVRPIGFGRRCCDLAFSVVSALLPLDARRAWNIQWTDTVNLLIWEKTRLGATEDRIGLSLIGEALALIATGWEQRQHYRKIGAVKPVPWELVVGRSFSGLAILAIAAFELVTVSKLAFTPPLASLVASIGLIANGSVFGNTSYSISKGQWRYISPGAQRDLWTAIKSLWFVMCCDGILKLGFPLFPFAHADVASFVLNGIWYVVVAVQLNLAITLEAIAFARMGRRIAE